MRNNCISDYAHQIYTTKENLYVVLCIRAFWAEPIRTESWVSRLDSKFPRNFACFTFHVHLCFTLVFFPLSLSRALSRFTLIPSARFFFNRMQFVFIFLLLTFAVALHFYSWFFLFFFLFWLNAKCTYVFLSLSFTIFMPAFCF